MLRIMLSAFFAAALVLRLASSLEAQEQSILAGIGNPAAQQGLSPLSPSDINAYHKDSVYKGLATRPDVAPGNGGLNLDAPGNPGGANVFDQLCQPGIGGCTVGAERGDFYRSKGVRRRLIPIVMQNPRGLVGDASNSVVVGDTLTTDRYGDYTTILNTAVGLTDSSFAQAQAETTSTVVKYAEAVVAADSNAREQMRQAGPEGQMMLEAYSAGFGEPGRSHIESFDRQAGVPLALAPYSQAADPQDQGIQTKYIEGHPLHDAETAGLTAVDGDLDASLAIDGLNLAGSKLSIVDAIFNPVRVANLTYTPGWGEPDPYESGDSLTKRKVDFRQACGDYVIHTYDAPEDVDDVAAIYANRSFNALKVEPVPPAKDSLGRALGPGRFYAAFIENAWNTIFRLLERRCAFSNWQYVPQAQVQVAVPIVADVSPSQYLFNDFQGAPPASVGAFWKDQQQRDALAGLTIPGYSMTADVIEALFFGSFKKPMTLALGSDAQLDCGRLKTEPGQPSHFSRVVKTGVADSDCEDGDCFENRASAIHREVFKLARNIGAAHFFGAAKAMVEDIVRMTPTGSIVRELGVALVTECAGTAQLDEALKEISRKTETYAQEGVVAATQADASRAGSLLGGRFNADQARGHLPMQ